jgi:hypothetical protein
MKNRGLKILALSALLLGANLPAISSAEMQPMPQYYSFSGAVEGNYIIDSVKKQKQFKELIKPSFEGISLKSMFMNFLPYLSDPNFSIDKGFELKLNPSLSLEATCNPFPSIQLESDNQQPRIGIYFKFKY